MNAMDIKKVKQKKLTTPVEEWILWEKY
jgi:hypothetical protein